MMKFIISLALVCLAQGFPQKSPPVTPLSSRIVGGEPATPNEFPYQIALLYNGRQNCGGSILDEDHVITAAHCVERAVSRYSVRAGEHNLIRNDGTEQEIAVSQIFIHSGWGSGVGTNANDIAILRLAAPLKFNNAVQKIALPNANQDTKGNVIVTGWGALASGGSYPNVLYKVTLPVIADVDCENMYKKTLNMRVNGDLMICAGFTQGGKDSCQGDSGGPLATVGNGQYLAGVVSWGRGCADRNYPGVYTEVAKFIPWIKSIIN